MYIGLTTGNRHTIISAADVANNQTQNLRALWDIDGAVSENHAIAILLAHAAGQYTPHPITRIIPSEPTHDERIEAARRILRADYWADVRNIVDDLKSEISYGRITDVDDAEQWLRETIDSHQRVIYTAKNFDTLMWSDNEGAYEEFGDIPTSDDGYINWEALAFYALRADVLRQIGSLDELVDELAPKICPNCDAEMDEGEHCANCDTENFCTDCGEPDADLQDGDDPLCEACASERESE